MSNTARSNTRRDRSAWQQLMAQYEASHISQRLFCEQHEITYSTFGYWRKGFVLAGELMTDICQREGILPDQVILHSDNGRPMKGATGYNPYVRVVIPHAQILSGTP